MKKYKIAMLALFLLNITTFQTYAKTPMYSTPVDQGLAKMFNRYGLVNGIYWNNGHITYWEDIGSGGGNASYPINLDSGTETAGILPTNQGGWGTTTPNLALVKQNSGTCTGMVADNANIGGTNSTATLRTLTVTETLTTGSQWDTAGSWTTTVGVGQGARIVSLGSSTNSISLECDGTSSITGSGASNISPDGGNIFGTSTFSSRNNKIKYYAVSPAVGTVSTTLTGTTTETVMVTIPVPAGFMSAKGTFEIYTLWGIDTINSGGKTGRIRFGTSSSGLSGAVLGSENVLIASSKTGSFIKIFSNYGTTTQQIGSAGFGFGSSVSSMYFANVNTINDSEICITLQLPQATDTVHLYDWNVKYYE